MNMIVPHTINFKRVLEWINAVWAKSLVAVVLFILGIWIGIVQTEGRIAGDCKFAGAFRVDIQAFNCQRRI
jgi:hypothetical protein